MSLDAIASLQIWIEYNVSANRDGTFEKNPGPAWNNPSRWRSRTALRQPRGVVFLRGRTPMSLSAIDLDKCVAGGVAAPWARDILDECRGAYVEPSISQTGLHVLGVSELAPLDVRFEAGKIIPKIFWNVLLTETGFGDPLVDITPVLEKLHTLRDPDPGAKAPEVRRGYKHAAESSDEDIVLLAIGSKGGDDFLALFRGHWKGKYGSQSEADLALASSLSFWTDYDSARVDRLFRASKLFRPKWDERRGDRTYGQRTLERAFRGGTP